MPAAPVPVADHHTITLSNALDQAVEKMPFIRRKVYKFRLRNERYRERVLDELALKLYDDPQIQAMSLTPIFGAEDFTAETPIQIDLGNLEQFLQIILKYLPQILELVLKFLPLFFPTLLVLLLPSLLLAQVPLSEVAKLGVLPDSCISVERVDLGVSLLDNNLGVPLLDNNLGVLPQEFYIDTPIEKGLLVQGRWKNYDGLSFRDHAEIMHGINTTGLSDAQVAALRDQDHDMYGGGHPSFLRSNRSTPVIKYSTPTTTLVSCPPGGCPVVPLTRAPMPLTSSHVTSSYQSVSSLGSSGSVGYGSSGSSYKSYSSSRSYGYGSSGSSGYGLSGSSGYGSSGTSYGSRPIRGRVGSIVSRILSIFRRN